MRHTEHHHCEIVATPWPGAYATFTDSARHFGRHWHDTYGIGVLDHGAHRSASGRGSVDAYAGELLATNPGEVHDGRPLAGPGRRWRMVYLEPAAFAAALDAGGGRDVAGLELTRPAFRDPGLADALRVLFAQLAGNRTGPAASLRRLACDEALVQLCGHLAERHATRALPRQSAADVARARECLADRWLDPPTLDELAAVTGSSKFGLLRRFRQTFGAPPHAWLRLLRIERARHLIAGGTALCDAAALTGFADQSHMTRAFAQTLGFTPGAWRGATGRRATAFKTADARAARLAPCSSAITPTSGATFPNWPPAR